MKANPEISVIICCYNSSERIGKTFEYIAKQQLDENINFEVIVVDNASTDDTVEIAKRFWSKQTVISFKVVLEAKQGLSNARTRGISEAVGEIIIFCDDDNWLDENYLYHSYEIMKTDASIGALGGMGIIENSLILPKRFNEIQEAYAIGEQYPQEGDITNLKGYLWGAGLVLRKEAWNKVLSNGFKGFYLTDRISSSATFAGGDTEICLLIQNAGCKIYYSNSLKFIHAISQQRLSWDYYKDMCKGFARSQVLLENYLYHFNESQNSTLKNYLLRNFLRDVRIFFKGWHTLTFYKIFYKEFVKHENGYLYGSYKRRYFNRIIARIKFFALMQKGQESIREIEKFQKVVLQ